MSHVKLIGKWKEVEIGEEWKKLDEFSNLISFEEIHDYQILTNDENSHNKKRKRKEQSTTETDNASSKKKKTKAKQTENTPVKSSTIGSELFTNEPSALPLWRDLLVPNEIMQALSVMNFTAPTPIQTLCLPPAIRDKMDIIGAAETGSGKTLAFGIPLLRNILEYYKRGGADQQYDEEDDELLYSINEGSNSDAMELEDVEDSLEEESSSSEEVTSPLLGLVLTPTRELAIQVYNHLRAAAKFTKIRFAVVVGGLSSQKQERLLSKCPEVVIATPGRLWELLSQNQPHLMKLNGIRTLVVDEADRMTEKGHFEEMEKLLSLLNDDETAAKRRQTLIFSATLTMVHSTPKRVKFKKRSYTLTKDSKLNDLISRIGVRGKPKLVDITATSGVAETVLETRIHCTQEEKDVYLYYLLHMHPGRTLVFCNSKDCLRRLVSVTTLLNLKPLPLHADMNQRQRLKNLDRFKENPKAVMLATDVAARGLDIPDVQHVVHYQVPRTIENYVHRSGRTARAQKEGVSVMLVGPSDMTYYRRTIDQLNKGNDLPVFPVSTGYVPVCKERVALACEIDKLEHSSAKQKAENTWFAKAAEEMDIELDDDLVHDLGDSAAQSQRRRLLAARREELSSMLRESMIPEHFSGKYITNMGKLSTPYSTDRIPASAIQAVKEDGLISKQIRPLTFKTSHKVKSKFKKRKRKNRE